MKTGFLITARLKSKRLPEKIIKDLNGKTVIEGVIDRAKEVKGISVIVLCTSTNPQDDPLIEIAGDNKINFFRGSEEDVLERLLGAAEKYNLDNFVSVTADNPLFSIYYSNLIVEQMRKAGSDYVKVVGLPIGITTHGLRTKALETICRVKEVRDTEIWGILIDRPEIFDVYTIKAKGKLNRPGLRLTLDYEEDYQVINNIYLNVPFKNVVNLLDVIDYLDKNPDVAEINQKCVQRDLDRETKEKINRQYEENMERIKNIKNKIYHS